MEWRVKGVRNAVVEMETATLYEDVRLLKIVLGKWQWILLMNLLDY